jgi:hypothetical protein
MIRPRIKRIALESSITIASTGSTPSLGVLGRPSFLFGQSARDLLSIAIFIGRSAD